MTKLTKKIKEKEIDTNIDEANKLDNILVKNSIGTWKQLAKFINGKKVRIIRSATYSGHTYNIKDKFTVRLNNRHIDSLGIINRTSVFSSTMLIDDEGCSGNMGNVYLCEMLIVPNNKESLLEELKELEKNYIEKLGLDEYDDRIVDLYDLIDSVSENTSDENKIKIAKEISNIV